MISATLLSSMFEHFGRCAPREGCGVLAVKKGKLKWIPCTNIAAEEEDFALDPDEYLKIYHGLIEGPIPEIDLDIEDSVQKICLELISKDLIKSAHDVSDGGLSVNISESVCFSKKGIGADINIERKLRTDEILFGESQGVIVVSLDSKNLHHVALIAQNYNIHTQTIGVVTDSANLTINKSIDLKRKKLEDNYFHSLEKTMLD